MSWRKRLRTTQLIQGIKDDSKLGGARRQALSSLTNGMASSRQPLAAKPLGPTRPLVEVTSKIRGKTAPSKTPAKARPTKKLNIYTPARSTVVADMDEVNHLHDEIEYMPPTAIGTFPRHHNKRVHRGYALNSLY